MKGKTWTRYTFESLTKNEPFEKGNIYFSDRHGMAKNTDYLICGAVCDTYKQLFKGTVDSYLEYTLHEMTSDGPTLMIKHEIENSDYIRYKHLKIPCDLKLKRMGKQARYRYSLQNTELGIYVLLGSYFAKLEDEASHLKIEYSPHFIASRTPKEIDEFSQSIADMFLTKFTFAEPEVHLAVDLQGWKMPHNMTDNIITRAKRVQTYKGIGVHDIQFKNLTDCVVAYGRAESFTIGSRSNLQSCFYRKDLEIIKADRVDYYTDQWSDYTLGSYDPEKPVIRIEQRFHHSVIKQFANGLNKPLTTFSEVSEYFTNLWQYALDANRYMYDNDYVHPLWQMLHDDVVFQKEAIPVTFKRVQAKSDTTAIKRNIANALGNLITMYASRTTLSAREITKSIKQADFYTIIKQHNLENSIDESVFFQTLEKRILERRISTKYALVA